MWYWPSGFPKWGINEEKIVFVKPTPGVSDTVVTIKADSGANPAPLHFKRADAEPYIKFEGTNDIAKEANQRAHADSPNNDHNEGGCLNEVGRDSGKYCISRTTVAMSTALPFFLQKPRQQCDNGGCGYGGSSLPVSLESGGEAVLAQFDNNESSVSLTIYADLWEHVTAKEFGGTQGP